MLVQAPLFAMSAQESRVPNEHMNDAHKPDFVSMKHMDENKIDKRYCEYATERFINHDLIKIGDES